MGDISLFIPAFTKTPSAKMTVDEFITAVKFGKWKKEVEEVRNEPSDEIRKKLKQKVAGVTVSGTFTERAEKNLIAHSNFIAIDIDGFTDRTALVADMYTYALFSSISNSGLCVIVKIDGKKHKESFNWLQSYYFSSYGITIDPAPSNPASLRFISYDPQCHVNEKSVKSKITAKKQQKPNSLPMVIPKDRVGEMVKQAVDFGVNIAEEYQSYVQLGFAIASGFGEDGRAYFHALASISSKYNSHHCDRQYNYCLKKPNAGITVGTFYYMLKHAGIEIPKDEEYTRAIHAAAIAKKSGRKKEDVAYQLETINGLPTLDAQSISEEVFKREDITLKTLAADTDKLIESLMEWMKANHPIRKNIITGKYEEGDNEVTKERINSIYIRARAAFNTPNVSYDLVERIIFSDFTPEYHPIKEYIEKNRHRNTSGNIDRIISCIKTNTPNAEIFIRKWLIAIPAAAEGYPVRLVLALVGKQKSGKTEYFRRLLPKKLQKYYGESKMDAGKDDELLMCQKLILMDDEMGGKSKQDEKRFKDLTSKNIFTLRAPYGRYNEDYKRIAVLCGTSNDTEVINDPTGNTRILPIEIESIDHAAYNAIDKDELFMEMVRVYESGEEWDLNSENLDKLNSVSDKHENIPFERELILLHFTSESFRQGDEVIEEMSATEVKDYIEKNSKQQIRSLKRLGIEMRKIFGERIGVKKGGKVIWVYRVVKLKGSGNNREVTGKVTDDDFLSGNQQLIENEDFIA